MVKRTHFHIDRRSKEHISLKKEGKIVIFLLKSQSRNLLKVKGSKIHLNIIFS